MKMVIFAPRSYSPGEVIYTEIPFVRLLPHSHRNELCQSCCRRGFNLRNCKQCSAVKYCGKACQTSDWKLHRLECKMMGNLPSKDNYDLVRLIGRVILKIKDKDWKDFKVFILGTEVNFDEIDPHYKEMTENPHLNLMYKEVKEDVTRFIGPENMPKDIDCLKIIGKVLSNTYFSPTTSLPISSLCFFIGISQFEAECVANSCFVVNTRGLKICASKEIQKGSDKITISKRRIFGGLSPLCLLDEITKLPCKCTDCSLPYGESILSKILDDKKAFSVIKTTETILKVAEMIKPITNSASTSAVDEILENHLGVLGRTNVLHLRLMAFRYLDIGGRAGEIKDDLEELEILMRSVFGEFYPEMLHIYKNLALVNVHLGNGLRAHLYLEKADKLDKFMHST